MKELLNKFKQKKFKKVLLAVGILILIALVLIILNKRKETTNNVETTGVIQISPPPITETDKLVDILITISPINESNFTLMFDYKNNRFSVTLNPATIENYNSFVTWKNDHGFSTIPISEFYFENYPHQEE